MPVSLVQRGPFSYDELTVAANQAGASPSAPRDFTLTNAIFDSTIGEVLEVFVNGVKLVGSGLNATGDEFTVDSNVSKITIETDSNLASATDSAVTTLAENDTVLIRRVSNRTAKKVDFAPGSVIREADLDNANTQVFHTAQEAIDIALQGMVLDADGRWNASSGGANRVIKNAATPSSSDPDDYVATKGYVDGQNATTTVASISGQVTTVAGISDDVTTVAGAVKETVAYTLTASGGKFYIAGGEFSSATSNPVLNLQRGSTYTFDYSDSSISSGSHVLGFSSADTNTNNSGAVAYTTGITDNTVDKIITFVVPASAPDTLYYYCTAHNAMGNTMNIAEDSIEIVADNIANVNKVGAIDSNVSTVAGIDSNVTTVAGIHGNVTTVANIGTNGADVTTVAGKATEIDTLVNGTDGTSGTSGSTNNLTLIDNVEGALPNINTVATNINSVSNFADTYHPSVDSSDTSRTSSTAAPGSASALSTLTEGDLWFDSNDNTLKVYDGSSFNAATSSIATVADQPEFSASDGQGTDNKYFALNHDVGLELVFLNGVRLKRGDDYYCTTSNTSTTPITSGNPANFIRLETVPGSSDILSVMAFGQVSASTVVPPSGGTFTGGVTFEAGTTHNTGSNTFTMPTTRGTDGQILTIDGNAGATTWTTTIQAPSIISVTGEINEDTNTTLTVTGSGFASGMTIKLINSSTGVPITGHTALSYSGSSSPLTVTIPSATTNLTAGLQVKLLIDKQGLTATSSQSITVSEDPNWTTTSGLPAFATIADTLNASGGGQTVGTLSASAGSGGGTIVYASDDSSLDTTYFSLNTSSGVITTTSTALTALTGSANYTEAFNANAKVQGEESTKNTLLSGINIIVTKSPTGGATGGSGSPTSGAYSRYTYGGTTYQVHKFITTGDSNFVLYSAKTVDVIVVGGGGSGGQGTAGTGGGGGGAGGIIVRTGMSLSAGTYLVKVGAGGVTPSNQTNVVGSNGDPSYFGYVDGSLSTSTELKGFGGGGGAAYNGSTYAINGGDGGSGGGATNPTSDHGDTIQTSHNSGIGYGNNGGLHSGSYDGGGGGAGGVGGDGGLGGSGKNNFLTDVATTAALLNSLQSGNGGPAGDGYLAGGGGGGGENNTASTRKAGGAGGGGQGGNYSISKDGDDGIANTGSGGGGIGRASGQTTLSGLAGDGGSGIVIIRYAI